MATAVATPLGSSGILRIGQHDHILYECISTCAVKQLVIMLNFSISSTINGDVTVHISFVQGNGNTIHETLHIKNPQRTQSKLFVIDNVAAVLARVMSNVPHGDAGMFVTFAIPAFGTLF